LFFHFCVFAFIADDILGCGLAVRYGVFTLLFATAKGARILVAEKMYSPDLFHMLVWARLQVGRVKLCLLDSNDAANFSAHGGIANGVS
jgi:hypothetical protein